MKCNKCSHELPNDSEFCQYCGVKVSHIITKETTQPIVIQRNAKSNKAFSFITIISIILSAISCVAVIFAMNLQDYDRNINENINPTLIYFILLAINITFLVLCVLLKKHNNLKLLTYFSLILALSSILALMEHSVFSTSYYDSDKYLQYINSYTVNVLNAIWVCASFIIFLLNYLPLIFKTFITKWHSSIKYREKCYNKVAKMHSYYEKGIITQEEFEETKRRITKNIEA